MMFRSYSTTYEYFLSDYVAIHQMQIWRIARSSPETSSIKARLAGLACFVLTGKSCFVVDLVYFLLPSIKVFVFVNTTRTERDLPQ